MPPEAPAVTTVTAPVPRLTPSGVQDLQCPRKFHRLRIETGNWPKRDVALAVSHGRSVHALLRDLYAARQGGAIDLSDLEAQARGVVWQGWYPHDLPGGREPQVQRVAAAARAFVEADDYEDVEGILELEREGWFEVRVDGRVLCVMSAVLDALLVRASQPQRLVVRERKTTAPRIDLKECYIQMRVARKMFPQYSDIAVDYDFLDVDGRVQRTTVSRQDVAGQHRIVLGTAYRVLTEGMEDGHWPACPGEGVCRFCPEREACLALPPDHLTSDALARMAEGLTD